MGDSGPHACTVHVSPLDHQPVRISGEGAMQALFLALRFVKHRLVAEEEDRSPRFFRAGDDRDLAEPFDWRHVWFGDAEPAPAP